jgi:hypothetical protein
MVDCLSHLLNFALQLFFLVVSNRVEVVAAACKRYLEVYFSLLKFLFVAVHLGGEFPEETDDVCANFVHPIVGLLHVFD